MSNKNTSTTLRIAINGFGRIGRSVVRALYESGRNHQSILNQISQNQSLKNQAIQIVAINDPAPAESMAHLLQYDSSHGRFMHKVSHNQTDKLWVHHDQNATDEIALLHCDSLEALDWSPYDVDIVLDCTGKYGSHQDGLTHIKVGAKQVLFSHPGDNDIDRTVIYGVNHDELSKQDLVVSNGSCTTNCIIPVIEVIDQAFGIESGTITTIHSSMNDQQVIDAHHSDLRRSRAASQSIIPVDTKLHLGIGRIYPHFADKFEAISVRVPTINVTAMDLSVTVKQDVTIASINQAIVQASQGRLQGILDYTEEPLVSIDFNHDPHSAIVDGSQTRVSNHKLVKLLVWCDNEWGFANRMLDTAQAMNLVMNLVMNQEKAK